MKINFREYLFSLLFLAPLGACNSDTTINKDAVLNSADSAALVGIPSNSVPVGKFDMVISDIPFPFEILDNLYTQKFLLTKRQ